MEALGFSKWALVLCLSLLWHEALPIILNEIHGGYTELKPGLAPCKGQLDKKHLLFIHTKGCLVKYRREFKRTLKKISAQKNFTFENRSVKLKFLNIKPFKKGECWSCLGRCHLKRASKYQPENHDGADQHRFESYECYKHEILLKLLMDHSSSATERSNFEDLSYPVKDRSVPMPEGQKTHAKGSQRNNKWVESSGGRKNITYG